MSDISRPSLDRQPLLVVIYLIVVGVLSSVFLFESLSAAEGDEIPTSAAAVSGEVREASAGDRDDGFNEVTPPQELAAYAPYWYIDQLTDSFLEVKNISDSELVVVPILRLSSDEPITVTLPPIKVAPLATTRVSLRSQLELNRPKLKLRSPDRAEQRWGDGSRPWSLLGNAQLIPASPKGSNARSFSAWVVITDPTEGLGLVTPFQVPADAINSVLEGLWWLPYPKTQAYFALQNTSRRSINLTMELFRDGSAGGTPLKKETFRFGPAAFKLINVGDFLRTSQPPDLGGIRFSYKLEKDEILPGNVIGRGMLIQEELGFSSSLMLHESLGNVPTDTPTELHAPAPYFGNLADLLPGSQAFLHPHLLLRNIGKDDVTVEGTIYGRDTHGVETSLELQPISLSAQSLKHIDLEEQRKVPAAGTAPLLQSELADGVAGLRLTHNSFPTDIIAELININPEGNVVFYDAVTNQFLSSAPVHDGISFDLTPGSSVKPSHQSFLIVKNVTDEPQEVRILLQYRWHGSTKQYDVLLPDIPAQQIEVVDIKHLRDARIPDRDGQILPPDLLFGGAQIFSRRGALVASNPTFLSGLPAPTQGTLSLFFQAGTSETGEVSYSCPTEPPPPVPCCSVVLVGFCRTCMVDGQPPYTYPGGPFPNCQELKGWSTKHKAVDFDYPGIKNGSLDVHAIEGGTVLGTNTGKQCTARDKNNKPLKECQDPDKWPASGVIVYNQGYLTVYVHIAPSVFRGREVKQNDVVGTYDDTGYTSGPHVHIVRLIDKGEFAAFQRGTPASTVWDMVSTRIDVDGLPFHATCIQQLANIARIQGEWPFVDP